MSIREFDAQHEGVREVQRTLLTFPTLGILSACVPWIGTASASASGSHRRCPWNPPPGVPPLVIGHRGASYNLPEHTLAGYRLALELGADYIEPDLVPTKDGVLVAIHSIDLNLTTDVALKFPHKRRTTPTSTSTTLIGTANETNGNEKEKQPSSPPPPHYSGYFVQDFTLEEIRRLRVRQRLEDTPARSRYFDGVFGIPTLTEIVDLLENWNKEVRQYIIRIDGDDDDNDDDDVVNQRVARRRRQPGMYAELKHPTLLQKDSGIHMADLFLSTLHNHPAAWDLFSSSGSTNPCTSPSSRRRRTTTDNLQRHDSTHYQIPPLVVQCFEMDTLTYLHNQQWWFATTTNTTTNTTTKSNSSLNDVDSSSPPPPMVLLINYETCRSNSRSDHNDSWLHEVVNSHVLAGIGPDKRCLLESSLEPDSMDHNLMDTAEQHGLAVHPWTERLEVQFLYNNQNQKNKSFATAEEEVQYLFCEVGVDGIFAENVDLAVRVATMGCDHDRNADCANHPNDTQPDCLPPVQSNIEKRKRMVPGTGIALCVGFLLGVVVTQWGNCRWPNTNGDRRQIQIPTTDTDDHEIS